MVLQVFADARPVGDDADPERASSAAGPTPESLSNCGELIGPPQRMTSRRARTFMLASVTPVMDAGGAAPLEGDSPSPARG